MRKKGSGSAKVDAGGSIADGAGGVAQYQWASGDTDTAGEFEGEFEVTYSSGNVRSYPNDGFLKIIIHAEIA